MRPFNAAVDRLSYSDANRCFRYLPESGNCRAVRLELIREFNLIQYCVLRGSLRDYADPLTHTDLIRDGIIAQPCLARTNRSLCTIRHLQFAKDVGHMVPHSF
jgi:hypothetical protein